MFFCSIEIFSFAGIKKNIEVRVLLNEKNETDLPEWTIEAFKLDDNNKIEKATDGGFIIYFDSNKGKRFSANELKIKEENSWFYINGTKIAKDYLVIRAKKNNFVGIDGVPYSGFFVLSKINDKFYLINFVELEEYVSSVLFGESWPGWPLEINEVFAIMCRTYAVNRIMNARSKENKSKSIFDLKKNNYDQTYKGFHSFENLRQAVKQTEGIVLSYDGKPIIAMYDSCCGGIVPSKTQGVVNFQKAPYLARDYACNYCKNTKIFSWTAEYSIHQLEKILSKEYPQLKKLRLKELKVTKVDPAGIVKQISIKTNRGDIVITGKKIYSLLKNIKSLNFKTTKIGHNYVFKGKGYGHQMGLCQWGARQMIKEKGWNFRQVLRFYYPDVDFMKIKLK